MDRKENNKKLAKEKIIFVEFKYLFSNQVNKASFLGYEVFGKWVYHNSKKLAMLNVIKSE